MSLAAPLLDSPPLRQQVQRQRGAYALAWDEAGRVLVVRTQNGRCYLPGGRIEPGETPLQALLREIEEECGWQAEVGAPICSGEQRIFGGSVKLQASYWDVRLTIRTHGEPEHVSLWLDPEEAAARLHRASDRRALALRLP